MCGGRREGGGREGGREGIGRNGGSMDRGREGGREKGSRCRDERKVGRGGILCMNVPLSGNTISRFFEILKTVVDYLKRQSGKSVMMSVSQSWH